MYICIYVCIVFMYVCMVYICIYACVYVCMYVCMYGCVCVYLCIYIVVSCVVGKQFWIRIVIRVVFHSMLSEVCYICNKHVVFFIHGTNTYFLSSLIFNSNSSYKIFVSTCCIIICACWLFNILF